jgi:hypothetical protein
MNSRRDIERTLETWFVDGPSVMPDRLFEAVFDQVERVPQRRVARLRLRLPEMTPRIRLFAAAAAALMVVVVALAVIGRAPAALVGASPNPSATPNPTPGGQLPTAIQGRWMGNGALPVSPLDPPPGTSMLITADNISITPSNDRARHFLSSRASDLGERNLRIELDGSHDGCADGDLGSYTWSLSPGGRIMYIEPLDDDCSKRMAGFSGDWFKMDCPTADDFCLGPLEAGQYASQFFDPFIGPGETWKPRMAALVYTVPAGWVNESDWPNSYVLRPQGSATDRQIFLFSDIVAVSDANPCSETAAEASVGKTPPAIKDWLVGADGIVATAPTAVTVGGFAGWRIDLSIDPAWTATCPFSEGRPYRGLFLDQTPGEGFSWGIDPDTRARVYLLDPGDGRALLVAIEAPTVDFDQFVESATSVVESFVFTP